MKQKIVDTAIQIIHELGISGLSMRNIANDLNVSATALYRHFKNKDEIILHLIRKGYSELLKQLTKALLAKNAKERLQQTMLNYFMYCKQNTTSYFLMNGKNLNEYSNLYAEIAKEKAGSDKFLYDRIAEFAIAKKENINIDLLKNHFLFTLNGFLLMRKIEVLKKTDEELDRMFFKIIEDFLA